MFLACEENTVDILSAEHRFPLVSLTEDKSKAQNGMCSGLFGLWIGGAPTAQTLRIIKTEASTISFYWFCFLEFLEGGPLCQQENPASLAAAGKILAA